MSTKDIRPTHAYIPCDICGRTLLRGERVEVFIAGGNRHQVCELCKPRALQEGWIREGAVPDYDPATATPDRRRSVFGRRRRGRDPGSGPATNLDEALSGEAWPMADAAAADRGGAGGAPADRAGADGANGLRQRRRERPVPGERAGRERGTERLSAAVDSGAERGREPRHVHAVPTGEDSKIAAAAEAFNAGEHPRTVAGVARSLGAPTVAVIPDSVHATLVRIIASWELCWYRYEVDLGADRASVRLDAQGYELAELTEPERIPAAVADQNGRLHVGA